MKISKTKLEGLLIIEPDLFKDHRGFFMESYNQKKYSDYGIKHHFVQDNISYSIKGTLRGLHFQITHPQAKLVHVISGEVFDVAVDIRPNSPNFGKWEGVLLSGQNKKQFLIPEGFAHGFFVLSDWAYFAYKCSDFYTPGDEGGILWSDPDINITWPNIKPLLSEKDKQYPVLKDLNPEQLIDLNKFK